MAGSKTVLRLAGFSLWLALIASSGAANVVAEDDVKVPPKIERGWSGGVDLKKIVPAYMGDNLEMAVLPTPKKVVYSNKMFEVGETAVVVPEDYPFASTLRDLKKLFPGVEPVGADAWKDDASCKLVVCVGGAHRNPHTKRWIEAMDAVVSAAERNVLGREGYLLFVTRDSKGRMAAVLAGNEPAGDFWAVQTVGQLLVEKENRSYLAGVWMLDWPSFPSRGSKGGREYMPEYKDNFWWGGPRQVLLDNFGHAVPYMSGGGELDCSAASLAKFEATIKEHFAAGALAFGVKFDDVIVGMTDETARRFNNDYGKAICFFMHELDRRAKRLDPKCKLYYLPQCYYSNSFYPEFAAEIRAAGGLPADTGLCWTGTDVFSRTIPLEDTVAYMEAFGCTKTKGLIYDNFMRAGDYFPITGRGPELLPHLAGVFSERSTRFNRMTRCDFNWNPEAYDPDRSRKLACRETVKRDPRAYRALYRMVSFYEKNKDLPYQAKREEKIARYKQVNVQLKRLLGPLERVLDPRERIVADLARAIDVRSKKEAKLVAAGFREAEAVRADVAPTLDGKLDDACWQRAPAVTNFVAWDQAEWQKLRAEMGAPVPQERQTIVRIAYDDENLYLGAECKSDKPFDETVCCGLSTRAASKYNNVKIWWNGVDKTVRDVYGVWHSPCLELFIAPGAQRMNYYHMVANVAGLTFDKYSGQPTGMWNPDWKVVGRVDKGGTGFNIEISIPLASFGVEGVEKGDVWAVNISRVWPGHQMWTFAWSEKGFHTPEDFGTLVFK